MQTAKMRFLLVATAVAATWSFGCGGVPGEGSRIVTHVEWSSSANQCLADETPISLNGVSSPATCRTLAGVARTGGLEVDEQTGPPNPREGKLCCSQSCTVTPDGMTCGPMTCVPCAS